MSHQLSYESNGRGVVVTFSGLVKGTDIYDLNEQIISHELFPRMRYQIWDFAQVKQIDLTVDQLRGFAIQDARAARINPGQKVAIIRRRPGPPTGLDNIFHVFEDAWGGYESRTFYSMDEARKWADPEYSGD